MQGQATPTALPVPLPYRPSWVDRLTAWIDRLPLPAWLFYVLLLLLMMLANNARQWIDGTAPVGTVDMARMADAVYSVYFLALIHYLDWLASQAFQQFSPLLNVDAGERQRLRYELTVLPSAWGYLAIALGILLALGGILLDPLAFGLSRSTPRFAWLYVVVVVSFNTAVLVAFAFHSARQLNLIHQLYDRAETIDLLNPVPLNAFATVTARTGLGLVIFAWFMVIQDPTPGLNPVSIGGVTALLLLGTLSFVLPLVGAHQRLVAEKQRLLAAVGERLTTTFDLLHAIVDGRDLTQIGDINQALASLKAERDILQDLPTWPWRPETLRMFVTAVLLPLVVWLLTSLLERLLTT